MGPEAPKADLQVVGMKAVPEDVQELQKWVAQQEASLPNIKPDNEARIILHDSSLNAPTEFALLYLHGFSASGEEGRALVEEVAKQYGCHLYLARIAGHGLVEEEPMKTLTAEAMYQSAEEAYAISQKLGERVVVMATSTGGTLGLKLAAEHPELAGLVMYSPNIRVFDQRAALVTGPWGLQLARALQGEYHEFEADAYTQKYWTSRYRIEAVIELQRLLDATMKPETFQAINQPVFLGYYFQNDTLQDSTVSVAAMRAMFDELGTPETSKVQQAFPTANSHVISNPHKSEAYEEVKNASLAFFEQKLGAKVE